MNKTFKRVISIILVILWMVFIFVNSSMSDAKSDYESKKVLSTIANVNSSNNTESKVESYNIIVRKAAHVTEFLVLTLLLYNLTYAFDIKKSKFIIILIIVVLYASSDEFHQMFVPGRGPSVIDVLIDSIGYFVGTILVFIFNKLRKKPLLN